MSRKLIVTKEAEADILHGYISYEEKQEGLGGRFLKEIELACRRILPNPFLYQEVEPDIRRAVTHKFPYLVFYTFDEETVQILAVIHGSQDPPYINQRLGA
ncbi:MAG: type II toxin-antitoxin system RelE/ParE family toxin [Nitrospira sp.]|nr:type II toxin-antitoxin system RelE/ParE family toxin [Nitrospira sp.]MCA9456251.1 type II toxin-antitoxin system RelE/ParE family toxin [Nitrospira sp.]